MRESYKGRRCFLTGHTGFKGAWLCAYLHHLGADMTGYALSPPTVPSLFDEAAIARLLRRDVRGDVRNEAGLRDAMNEASPEVVFHLAAQPIVRASYEEPRETFETNVLGTLSVLEAVRHCPSVRAVVVVTSDKCYENASAPGGCRESDALGGRDPYSASKAAAEIVSRAYAASFLEAKGIALATARAGNVLGGGDWAPDRIIPDLVRAVAGDIPLLLRNPNSARPWQYVVDVIHGYALLGAGLLHDSSIAGAWNFGPEPSGCHPVSNLVDAFIRAYGRGKYQIAGGSMREPWEAPALTLNCAKAREQLRWRPLFSYEETVRHTAEWYRVYAEGRPALELCMQEIENLESRADGAAQDA